MLGTLEKHGVVFLFALALILVSALYVTAQLVDGVLQCIESLAYVPQGVVEPLLPLHRRRIVRLPLRGLIREVKFTLLFDF
jgi:hypothetical protein